MSTSTAASPENENQLSAQEARDKNKDEYNATAAAYDEWQASNVIMKNMCYYSTINELEKEGIEGKTFLEVGCGPCPVGQQLAAKGAKKIYGLDISQEMIDDARVNLTNLGIIDQFELVVADIFDSSFTLPEKVDGVILSYTLTTFINNFDMLAEIINQCSKQVKKDTGFLFITDFSWVVQPLDNWFFGMYTSSKSGACPKDFETFQFHIETAPDADFDIFQIPAHLMFKAGMMSGFKQVDWFLQYPSPEFKDNKVIRRYLDTCDPSDYLMKFKF